MTAHYRLSLLLLAIVLALFTRFTGLMRGESDYVSSELAARGLERSFFTFHPDEETLVRAALELADPLDPPLTAYGMLPLYLWRVALVLADPFTDADLSAFDEARPQIYLVIRLLSISFSLMTLVLVWHLGRRLFGDWAAVLGTFFFAGATAAIQLAHFATVDGLHALLYLGAFVLILRALELSQTARDSAPEETQHRRHWLGYALAGLAIGTAGAVRLNSLLLGPVLWVGYLLRCGGLRALATPPPWIAGLASLLTIVALQPYMALDPGRLFRAETTADLGFSLAVARGQILRIWTLVDVHTTPYLHYGTDLLPLAVGWPLTLGILAGIGHALWRRRGGLLLLFCALYFAQVGGLHTKHVRYILPLLPFLCLLAADFCVELVAHQRRLGLALGAVLVLYTGLYGLAFSRIYTQEDSRIQAARFVAERVPPGRVIGLERGGFSMDALVRGPRNPTRQLNATALFEARGYATCRAALDYLDGRLKDLEYIAIVDVNRYRQFAAVPDLTPAAAAFYQRLLAGELGYRVEAQFKQYPALFGVEFRDDEAEPSFTGYDHPTVYVLSRESAEAVQAGLNALARDLDQDPRCPDRALRQAVAAVQAADWGRAQTHLQKIERDYPHLALTHRLKAEVFALTDQPEQEQEARDRYRAMARHRAAHVLPWGAAMGFVDLGLVELAEEALTEGTLKSPHFPPWAARDLARAYVLLANYAYDLGYEPLAWTAYQQSSQIDPSTAAYNRLAFLAFRRENHRLAVEFWGRSVHLDDDQAGIHSNLGQVYAQHLGDYARALQHLGRAIQLDPKQRQDLIPWVEMARRNLD